MKIIADNGIHIVTQERGQLVVWNRLHKRTMASYSVYRHFGDKLYGRHDKRSSLYSQEGLQTVARVVANQLLSEEAFMDEVLEEYRSYNYPVKGEESEPIGVEESTRPFLY